MDHSQDYIKQRYILLFKETHQFSFIMQVLNVFKAKNNLIKTRCESICAPIYHDQLQTSNNTFNLRRGLVDR